MKYFVSYMLREQAGTQRWTPQNAIIDVHPLVWLQPGAVSYSVKLMFWAEVPDGIDTSRIKPGNDYAQPKDAPTL